MLQNTDKTRQRYKTSTKPPNKKQRYQLSGTYTDLAEVVKGLFEAGILQGNQSDFFNDLCNLLQVKQTNLKDLLKGIIRRKRSVTENASIKVSVALLLWKTSLEASNSIREEEKIRVKKLGF
jgi:hypothetical protein